MLDTKQIDPVKYKALTAQPLQPTLHCAERLVRLGKAMRIRYVLVSGWSDDAGDVSRLADYVAGLRPLVEMVEVLPFHQLGTSKWSELGMEYRLRDTPTPTIEATERAWGIFRVRGPVAC